MALAVASTACLPAFAQVSQPLVDEAEAVPWIAPLMPVALLRPGPGGLEIWQLVALPVGAVLAVLIGSVVGRIGTRILRRVARRTRTRWDDAVFERAAGPLTLLAVVGAAVLIVPSLALPPSFADGVHRAARAGSFLAFFWAIWRSSDVAREIAAGSAWAKGHPGAVALAPLATRVLKVMVLAVGVVAMVSELGYPIASLVAGLGIGGLALALAAQKTLENLFGAFSLGADQPFREGDFVKVEDFVGTVEAIGLRSTQFRTLDRTIITIPNGKLAEMRLETFAARDRIRLACDIGLVYETSSAQMREVLAALEAVLREHPKIWSEAIVVRFKQLSSSSLDIEVMAWFNTTDWGEFQLIRQDVLLMFMQAVEAAGTSFAFPTQTVHVVGDGAVGQSRSG